MITHYRRNETSPWMAMPAMSRSAVRRWLMLGAYSHFVEIVDGAPHTVTRAL